MSAPPVALYYPHTRIQSRGLLKTALLFWDYIECIVPNFAFEDTGSASRETLEAEELVVRPHVPDDSARYAVHEMVKQRFAEGVPEWLQQALGSDHHYLTSYVEMHDEKLPPGAWELLEDYDVVRRSKRGDQHHVPELLALFLLSLLADQCAGRTRLKVTDRTDAYTWLQGLQSGDLGGQFLPSMSATNLATNFDRLATIAIKTADLGSVPMRKLIRLRKQEHSDKTHDLRKLRLALLDRTSQYVHDLVAPENTAKDIEEIQRQYTLAMEGDLRDIKVELGFAAKKVLFSKEIAASVVALAGVVVAAPMAPPVAATLNVLGVGALLSSGNDYRKARREVLSKHPMSWLYLGR